MLFWRVFLAFVGMVYGAIFGLELVTFMAWRDGLLIGTLGGGLLGAVCGWGIASLLPKAVERLRVKFQTDGPPIPPPRGVVRLGAALGLAEGIIVGAIYSGPVAVLAGGYVSTLIGLAIAILSWRVRRHVPLLALALLLGFLIELVGCLLIVQFVKGIANDPRLTFIFAMQTVVVGFLYPIRLLFRPARPEEKPGPHET